MKKEEYINKHPEQFKDDIDKWLFTEFGIIGGCCSAEKSHEYSVARMVAERYEKELALVSTALVKDAIRQKQQLIEKFCEWLQGFMECSNLFEYEVPESEQKKVINDFKQSMKEQL